MIACMNKLLAAIYRVAKMGRSSQTHLLASFCHDPLLNALYRPNYPELAQ